VIAEAALAAVMFAAPVAAPPAIADVQPRVKGCNDRLVKWIERAGFKGAHVRVAWAVAMRESNGQPGESSWPDLGLMQLNAPSWQGTKYWPVNVFDPIQNLKAARKMVDDMNWQPWGLRVHKGKVSYDFSAYSGWTWQRQAWIVEPFERYYAQFPRECRS
jgi:hypothetical protein